MMARPLQECSICRDEYGGKVVPTLLICCNKDVCFICVEKNRNCQIAQLEGNRKQISCMLCKQKYHCSKDIPWRVNDLFIEYSGIDVDLTDVKETQAAMQSAANHRSQRRGPRRSNAADANAADSNFESLNRANNESDREGEANATGDEDTYDVSQDVGVVSSVEETSNSREDKFNSPNNREGDREGEAIATGTEDEGIDDVSQDVVDVTSNNEEGDETFPLSINTIPKNSKIGRSRLKVATIISYLYEPLSQSENWSINRSSFHLKGQMPLDLVEFNEESRRYEAAEGSSVTEDDFIAQSMVVWLLYRFEKSWGLERCLKSLSIWSGNPAMKQDDDFPLENLWQNEIRTLIRDKKLGQKTLAHQDNFDAFQGLYGRSEGRGRWGRRSDTYLGQVHILGEQAVVQMALHLHQNVDKGYALLANLIINMAIQDISGKERDDIMYVVSNVLLESAQMKNCRFPEAALNAFRTREEELIEMCSDDESMQTTDSTLVAANARTDNEEEAEEGPPEQKNSSTDTSQGPVRREANNQIIQKPLFNKGDKVAAKWEEDNKWYHGKIVSYEEFDSKSRYGPTRKYHIRFDDGDEGSTEDYNVFHREDYDLIVKRNEMEWKGVKIVKDAESSDVWAKLVGWYEVTTVEGETLEFSSLLSAMQAYDASVLRQKGSQTKEDDLNLPDGQLNIRSRCVSSSDAEANESVLHAGGRECKRRKLDHSIDEGHALRKSSLITRKQLACLTGGKVDKHQMGNPLNVGTPVTYCGGPAIATSNGLAHHICIKEVNNHPYPQNTLEQFVMCRIAPKNGESQQRDVELFLRVQSNHHPIPVFWEPANQSGQKKVTYLGHWKIAQIEDMRDRHFQYNGSSRCAKLYFDFDHFNERWEHIINLCHDKTVQQIKAIDF